MEAIDISYLQNILQLFLSKCRHQGEAVEEKKIVILIISIRKKNCCYYSKVVCFFLRNHYQVERGIDY